MGAVALFRPPNDRGLARLRPMERELERKSAGMNRLFVAPGAAQIRT
jgi:hypothetical protein